MRNADIEDVLVMLTEQSRLNLVFDDSLKGKVTIVKTLELEIKVSSSSTSVGANNNSDPPDIIRRKASTTVRVKDGQTLVLGSLLRDNGSNTVSKVALLRLSLRLILSLSNSKK